MILSPKLSCGAEVARDHSIRSLLQLGWVWPSSAGSSLRGVMRPTEDALLLPSAGLCDLQPLCALACGIPLPPTETWTNERWSIKLDCCYTVLVLVSLLLFIAVFLCLLHGYCAVVHIAFYCCYMVVTWL